MTDEYTPPILDDSIQKSFDYIPGMYFRGIVGDAANGAAKAAYKSARDLEFPQTAIGCKEQADALYKQVVIGLIGAYTTQPEIRKLWLQMEQLIDKQKDTPGE